MKRDRARANQGKDKRATALRAPPSVLTGTGTGTRGRVDADSRNTEGTARFPCKKLVTHTRPNIMAS